MSAEMDHATQEALKRLRFSGLPMSEWERVFLVRCQHEGCSKPQHRKALAHLVKRYLDDEGLSAEILGQQRLFR